MKTIMKSDNFATEKEGKIVDFMAVFGRHARIPSTLSSELDCSECKGKEHYAPYEFCSEDGKASDNRRVWICANPKCPTMQLENIPSTYDPKKYEKK